MNKEELALLSTNAICKELDLPPYCITVLMCVLYFGQGDYFYPEVIIFLQHLYPCLWPLSVLSLQLWGPVGYFKQIKHGGKDLKGMTLLHETISWMEEKYTS